jgi:hypothetical protein
MQDASGLMWLWLVWIVIFYRQGLALEGPQSLEYLIRLTMII